MSKERLESLKRNREWTEATGGKFYTVDSDDYKWLIKQAERAHELEKQNKRYKQALEYIQRAIYTQHCTKNHKWNSEFEKEFEKGQIIGLIQASNIVDKAIRKVEGEV